MYGQLYDSLVAAAKKDSKEQGYLAPDVCNQIIEDMRKVIKKFLDVDLKGIYTVTESKEDDITDEEILELYNYTDELENAINEEFIKKLLTGAAKGIAKGYQAIGSEKLVYLIEELIKIYGRDKYQKDPSSSYMFTHLQALHLMQNLQPL